MISLFRFLLSIFTDEPPVEDPNSYRAGGSQPGW